MTLHPSRTKKTSRRLLTSRLPFSLNRELCYTAIASLFCICLVLTNTIGHKLIAIPFFNFAVPAALLVYPLTFVLSDVVNEIYGRQKASFMVLLGFFSSIFVMCVIRIVLILPGHSYWHVPKNPWGFSSVADYQNAFEGIFAVNPTIVFSSMIAFLCGQFLDISCFQKIRKLTQNRFMWLRNNVSTMLSQLVDTIIISGLILFYGLRVNFIHGIEIMMASYLFKVLASIATTPLFYALVFSLRRFETRSEK